ncbi:MAG: hypothetical protein KDC07_06865, partial [Chitinophagaceae bacterium]|nr:hypothetical protein [Chitinophagaceae bacterium]
MKNILNKTTLLFLAAAITLTACNRQEDEIAGKGGKATIKATPKHHDINIDSCTIHLKYNASDMPSSYDEEVKCVMENGKPVATFTDLKKGKYYLYG